jgi:hypothetical protein
MQETTEVTETYLANKTAQVEGTSLASMNALTIITFNTLVNNYTITIKAVTQPAKWNIKSVNTNSGCPYDENFENELGAIIAKPCNRVLGPFPGSPYQKNLRQSITKTIVDPDSNGKGKTVETISFNLTR